MSCHMHSFGRIYAYILNRCLSLLHSEFHFHPGQGNKIRHHFGYIVFECQFSQSVPITTNVVSLNPAQARCTRYNIM